MSEGTNYPSCGDFRPGQGRDRIGSKMKMRRAVFAVFLTITSLVPRAGCEAVQPARAMAAKPAATTAKPAPSKPPRVIDLDWKELLPEGERSHFTAIAPPPVHDYRGEGGPPPVQAQDVNVNKSLEGTTLPLRGG